MSRRHHGRPHHHGPGGADRGRRPATGAGAGAGFASDPAASTPTVKPPDDLGPRPHSNGGDLAAAGVLDDATARQNVLGNGHDPASAVRREGLEDISATPLDGATMGAEPALTNGHGPGNGMLSNGAAHDGHGPNGNAERNGQCTAPQLRRFIKSRPYVPMHELRRRFGIVGPDDDVTAVKLEPGWVYVGLPTREGSLLGDLLRSGEIGYELSLDPRTPIVIGVYPMRPIPRS
jgi:hypothetical protein